ILRQAKYPLIYGLAETTCETQRAAVGLADQLGAVIDVPGSWEHGPIGTTFHGVGEVTGSLGEVKNRGDLLLIWNADPVTTHPRHFSRYSLDAVGMFLPRGRADRFCVVVNSQTSATTPLADLALTIKPGSDF